MGKTRLEAFSDGVIAILITVMVLELRIPHGTSWSALGDSVPVLLTYVLSFLYLGIYWNNHHHMLMATEHEAGSSCGPTCTCCSGCPLSRSPPGGWARTSSPPRQQPHTASSCWPRRWPT